MKTYRLTLLVFGLALVLGAAPSWGQDPSGNDTSDSNSNTGGGFGALVHVTTGTFNTAYGHDALASDNSGILNTGIGQGALGNNTGGIENTAVGAGALGNNSGGGANTAVGFQALLNNTANNNTAFGFNALLSNTTGTGNTAIGLEALQSSNGTFNTAVGLLAGQQSSIASFNTVVGARALITTTSGGANTAVGYEALGLKNTTSGNNTAIGTDALANSTGSSNVAVGSFAGSSLSSGSGNTYLGTGIGSGPLYSESGTMRLGRNQSRTFISGVAFVPVTGKQVFITNGGQLGILASSARFKRDIQTMGDRSRRLLQLRPVTFRYKKDPQHELQYGLIAEEVAKVYPELVTKGSDGKVDSVQYHELIPMLVNELQHQQQQLSELKAQNERLQALLIEQNAALAARLARFEEANQLATLVSH